MAERIADEVIAQRRDLMAYRPLLVGTARAVVSSEPFRAGFRRAAQSAHAALFSQSAERVALSVPDLGVLVRSALAHDPALAARIPARLRGERPGRAERARRARPRAARAGSATGSAATRSWRSARASLLLFLGIALPRDRRQARC